MDRDRSRSWRGLLMWLLGFVVSVGFVVAFSTDYVTLSAQFFDRHVMRGIDVFPPEPGEFASAKRNAVVFVDHVGSPEYYEIESAYSRIGPPPGEKLSFLPQPFRTGAVDLSTSVTATIVMWPRGCNDEGCRHDLLAESEDGLRLLGTVHAFQLATTDRSKNGMRVLAESDGSRYFWWDGDRFVRTD